MEKLRSVRIILARPSCSLLSFRSLFGIAIAVDEHEQSMGSFLPLDFE